MPRQAGMPRGLVFESRVDQKAVKLSFILAETHFSLQCCCLAPCCSSCCPWLLGHPQLYGDQRPQVVVKEFSVSSPCHPQALVFRKISKIQSAYALGVCPNPMPCYLGHCLFSALLQRKNICYWLGFCCFYDFWGIRFKGSSDFSFRTACSFFKFPMGKNSS